MFMDIFMYIFLILCGIFVVLHVLMLNGVLGYIYQNKKTCGSWYAWLFMWYWGATKWGEREWALTICGCTIFNELVT